MYLKSCCIPINKENVAIEYTFSSIIALNVRLLLITSIAIKNVSYDKVQVYI
nr:MAG TPA: hypothetical protein [Caudoviricetes sp.]